MTTDQIVGGVVGWAASVCSIGSTYTFLTGQKSKELPDVAGDVTERRFRLTDPDFPHLAVQQAALDIYVLSLSFLADNSDEAAAASLLRGFSDALVVSLHGDLTLMGTVFSASPFVTFDFARPFVEYEDATVGREMTMQLSVAQLVDAEV